MKETLLIYDGHSTQPQFYKSPETMAAVIVINEDDKVESLALMEKHFDEIEQNCLLEIPIYVLGLKGLPSADKGKPQKGSSRSQSQSQQREAITQEEILQKIEADNVPNCEYRRILDFGKDS